VINEAENPAIMAAQPNEPGENPENPGVAETPEGEALAKEKIEGEPVPPHKSGEVEGQISEEGVNAEASSAAAMESAYLKSGTPAEDFYRKRPFRELGMQLLEPGIKGVTPENYDLWHAIHPRYSDQALIYSRHAEWARAQTLAALRGAARDAHAAQEAAFRANQAVLQALRRPTSSNFPQMRPPKMPLSPWPVEMPSNAVQGAGGKMIGWLRADPSPLGPKKPARPPEEQECDDMLKVRKKEKKLTQRLSRNVVVRT